MTCNSNTTLEITHSDKPIRVQSNHVRYSNDFIETDYTYSGVSLREGDNLTAVPYETKYKIRTETKLPKLGLMMVGWGGNNGSTLTASLLANRHKLTWTTKTGRQQANYYGSIVMASTVRLGVDPDRNAEIFVPLRNMLPMVHPDELVISGWDINSANLAEACERAGVLEPDLRRQLKDELTEMKPLPSIYYPDFIAANQRDRADNLLPGNDKGKHLDLIRQQIRKFKKDNNLDKIVVVWTANTERFAQIIPGVNDTADNLLKAIKESNPEISPSTIYAVAALLETRIFINGSPQNTLVPGVVDLALKTNGFIGGDDFKSGQTKLKSVLVDFLVSAGIKPVAITSYNHLGNNDGKNLSAPQQFRSKEVSKSNVVDDMVASNRLLYKADNDHPDHVVVIKYVPSVGDSKRALDEYESEIFMGGRSTISIHNVCEDSLLASPLIIDLTILAELLTRITFKRDDDEEFVSFHPVLSLLSYLLKAPVVPKGAPLVNALFKQRVALENILRACIGLPPNNAMNLEFLVAGDE